MACVPIAEASQRQRFTAKNGLVLRNPAIVNFFDLCAISLPLPRAGGLPVGLMLVARNRAVVSLCSQARISCGVPEGANSPYRCTDS